VVPIFHSNLVYPTATLPPMKDSGLRIRVERALRDKFLALCRKQDRPAAQVLREFMRSYIAANQNASQEMTSNKKKQDDS
jgi:hypothetical protein